MNGQQHDDGSVAVTRGGVDHGLEAGAVVRVLAVDVCAVRHEEVDDIGAVEADCGVQSRRMGMRGAGVRVHAVGEEILRRVKRGDGQWHEEGGRTLIRRTWDWDTAHWMADRLSRGARARAWRIGVRR